MSPNPANNIMSASALASSFPTPRLRPGVKQKLSCFFGKTTEIERHFRVYEEAPSFRPAPPAYRDERVRDVE